jgi:hypothetical protein
MAFGFGPSREEISRNASDRWEAARRQASGPAPTPRPLVGPGGMFWETFQAPTLSGHRPEPERQPAPWEYGPPAPSIGAPPRAPGAPPPLGQGTVSTPPSFDMDFLGLDSGRPTPLLNENAPRSSPSRYEPPLPPPPQPSGLRVKLQGGDWQEADPDGRLPMPPTERSETAYDPVDRRAEPVSAPSGGGTFSMMTAPENEDVVTRGSQLEDAQFRAQMREYDDPYADEKAVGKIRTDEAIRLAEAQDRISMGKQAKMAQEAKNLQAQSDQNEFALAQKYGIDPRDTEGQSIQDEGRRMQYQQERESLKREIQAQMTILLSRYGMAPRSAAGYEALSGF